MDPSGFRQAANDWLKKFAVCIKNVSMYSPEHPRAKESLERSRQGLEDLFQGRPSIALTCADGRISLENVPVERDQAVSSSLVSDLTARNIKSVEFAAGFSPEEYAAFIRSLLLKPEKIAERGGMEAVLLDEGVSSIGMIPGLWLASISLRDSLSNCRPCSSRRLWGTATIAGR